MPTERKTKEIEELKDRLGRCSIVVTTNPRGLNASAMNDLRSRLRAREVEYRIVKNSLAYIAADAVEKAGLKQVVQGPTGLAFGYADPTEVAKALDEFIRTSRSSLSIQGGLLDRRVLTAADVTTLTTLPPKPVVMARLLGQVQMPIARLVGQLQTPMVRLATSLRGPLAGLSIVLQQRARQMQSQG